MHPILQKLRGGDLRSIGRSNEIVAMTIAQPALVRVLFSGLESDDLILRARAADALEKITRKHPDYLYSFKSRLIGRLAEVTEKEVRWHIAQMLPRVDWTSKDRQSVLRILSMYLKDESSIVKTFAMQALADIARQIPTLLPQIRRRIRHLTNTGTPAMQARGRRLLIDLAKSAQPSLAKTRSRRRGK